VLLVLAQNYLQSLVGDRWLLWLGLAFVLAVYFAPSGIVGALKGSEAKAN
jgi:branched-chain amino acid transport system permease protein